MKKFIRKYYIEIILLIIALAGVILLVGNFSFQDDLLTSISQVVGGFFRTIRTAIRTVTVQFTRASNSEIAIFFIVLGALALVVHRMRLRYKQDPDNAAGECPRCGNTIKRIHRSWFDRLLGKTIMPNSRRYACTNHYCGWKGLRRYQYRAENMRRPE